MTKLYGIKNCDSVKKAKRWLDEKSIAFDFHDFRTDGLDQSTLTTWCEAVGFRTLLNNRSTTWRQLPEKDREDLNGEKAIALMLSHPTLIKRPVLVHDKNIVVGFKSEQYQEKLS